MHHFIALQILSDRIFRSQNDSSTITIIRHAFVSCVAKKSVTRTSNHRFRPPSPLEPAPSPLELAPPPTPTDFTILAVVLAAVIVLVLASAIFWFVSYRKRASVSRSVDDVILELRGVFLNTGSATLKDLSKLDDEIKLHLSNVRLCEEILSIVSKNISELDARVQVGQSIENAFLYYNLRDFLQHLWCLLLSCTNLSVEALGKLNAFLDDKRHSGRVRCVLVPLDPPLLRLYILVFIFRHQVSCASLP
jgi:hypothetical protein